MNMLTICLVATCLSGPAIVTDGDTLKIHGQAVRLAGIDAQEIGTENGEIAREQLRRLVDGQIVTCLPTGQRSYNRIVAHCAVGEMELNAEMVRRGKALDCAHYSGGKYRALEPAGIRLILSQARYC